MTSNVINQVEQFRDFVVTQIHGGQAVSSLDELYDQWRFQNLDPDELEVSAKAIAASLNDYRNGIVGQPAHEFIEQFKARIASE